MTRCPHKGIHEKDIGCTSSCSNFEGGKDTKGCIEVQEERKLIPKKKKIL